MHKASDKEEVLIKCLDNSWVLAFYDAEDDRYFDIDDNEYSSKIVEEVLSMFDYKLIKEAVLKGNI